MSFLKPDADDYWESYRERYEQDFGLYADDDGEPEYEDRSLYLDEEGQTEELEAEFGCRMDQLDDNDLREIVERFTGGKEKLDYDYDLKWDPRSWCIDYRVKTA